jgi:hypothetical protein
VKPGKDDGYVIDQYLKVWRRYFPVSVWDEWDEFDFVMDQCRAIVLGWGMEVEL